MWLFYASQDRGLPGKLEPVSPVSPAHGEAELELLPARLSKEELIQNMDRVDREITMVEQQISKLKKKQVRGCGLEGNTLSLLLHAATGPVLAPAWPQRGGGSAGAPGSSVSLLPVVTWLLCLQSAAGSHKVREGALETQLVALCMSENLKERKMCPQCLGSGSASGEQQSWKHSLGCPSHLHSSA